MAAHSQQRVRPRGRTRTFQLVGVVLLAAFVVVVWGGYALGWAWTGLSSSVTLWDWLEALALPVVVGVSPVLLRHRDRLGPTHLAAVAGSLLAFAALALAGYVVPLGWTGFTGNTLWDWFELALLPVVLATTSLWLGSELPRPRPAVVAAFAAAFAGLVLCGYLIPWAWTGFRGNTAWDWIKLLLVPALVPTVLLPAVVGRLSDRLTGPPLDESPDEPEPGAAASGPRILRYAAFTDAGAGGNPAGVVLEASGLDADQRLAVAAEVGYSETAFVERVPSNETTSEPGRYVVRYFSPRAEVAFCGHATIAAAVALAERDGPGPLELDTLAGPILVDTRWTPDGIAATLTSAPTRTRPADDAELRAALAALRWSGDDLDPRYPPHVAFGGVEHLVLALRDRSRLAALAYDFPALERLMADRGWTTVHMVWAESPTVFHARDAFPPGGFVEDPATGAAAAAFGGYLRDLGLVDLPARVTILQGADMGRPSRLVVDVTADDRRARVSGFAAPVAARAVV